MKMDRESRSRLVETYNRYARERDAYELEDWKARERDHFTNLLEEQHTRTVLEVGAGPGRDSRFFQDKGFAVVCIDRSPEMVRLCREKGLSALVVDVRNLGFPEARFDAIWALNCLLHVPKPELPHVLKGLRAVLKPTGLFYLGLWGGIDFEGVWENDRYTPQRFFAFYPDQQIQMVVADVFELLDFKVIAFADRELHFQSMVLRK